MPTPAYFLMTTQCDFRFLVDIHDEEKESFLVGLRQARFISLLIDGATDSGNLKDEIVYVKFVDAKRGPVQRFLGIHDVRHANADGVLATVDIGRRSLIKSTVYFCRTKCLLVREHYCLCFLAFAKRLNITFLQVVHTVRSGARICWQW